MNNCPIFQQSLEDFDDVMLDCNVVEPDEFLSKQYIDENKFSLFHLNIRSCRSNFSQLKTFLRSLTFFFTVIVLTETWLNESIDCLFEIEGYISHAVYRNSHGGGIKVFIRDGLTVNLKNNMTFISDLFECLTLEVFLSKKKYLITSIYRPPHKSISQFNDCFQESILSEFSSNCRIIICGDFNINLFNPLSLNSIGNFVSLMLSFNYLSTIVCPTKFNPNNLVTKFSLIDHIWVNFNDVNLQSGVITDDITDHYSTFITFQSINKFSTSTYKYRILNESTIEKFQSYFNSLDFADIFVYNDVTNLYNIFYSKLLQTYNKNCPIKTKKCKLKSNSPWITPDLKFCLKKKFSLLKLLKQNLITKESYVKYRNLLISAIKQAKVLYFLKKSISNNNDVKSTWKFINSVLNKNKKERVKSINDPNGTELTGVDMANYFNSYFTNIIPDIVSSIPDVAFDVLQNIPSATSSFYFFPICPREIEIIILKLKDKPCNINDISVKALKSVYVTLSFILCYIFNLHVQHGIYPNLLKKGRVVPIYKAGSPRDVGNYRPITTLSTLNKIFEKIIHKRMISYIEHHNLISQHQFGFKRNSSTTLAIFDLITSIVDCIKCQKFTVCVFLDLRKAFDSVNHKLLLNKLLKMGFRGSMYSLIKDYLTDRSQYIDVDGFTSTSRDIVHGVPQGSVLGPLLFNLFFNDIVTINCDGRVLFADDGVFRITDTSFDRLILRLNILLRDLSLWLSANKLCPNSSKTFLMLFTNKVVHNFPDVYFNNDLLQWVNHIKYLGLIIDNKINFNLQINYIHSKISRGCGIIYRLKSFFPRSLLLKLYFTLIYPYLTQNIIIWGGVSQNKLNPIQIQINKTLRIILDIQYDNFYRPLLHTNDMFKNLNLLKITDIYEYFILKFIHSCFYGNNNRIFVEYVINQFPNHSHNTRNVKLNYPTLRLELEKSMTFYNFIRVFNSLPSELLLPQSFAKLKRDFKKYAISKY